jgi:phi LC3 family holin
VSKINWRVRLKNKNFWVAMISSIILLIQQVAGIFGANIDLGSLGDKLLAIVNTVFVILALVGVVSDPTTDGISDSDQALAYTEPRK